MADTIKNYLEGHCRTELSSSVIPALLESITEIGKALRKSHHVALAGSANVFGDDQLNVDVTSENLVRDALAKCPSVATASSEEDPTEKPAGVNVSPSKSGEQYTVAFDPLDGSSIIGPNWSVGTIIGIWDGKSALHLPPSEKQIGSILGVYGPRTTAIVALRITGTEGICLELGLGDNGAQDVQVIRDNVQLAEAPFKTRYFAPANLRATAESEQYLRLVNSYMEQKYTLRYSGGLVPDVVHALVKGHGIYLSPVTGASKAKLRRLYELYPVALIVECAGGKAIDPEDGSDILSRALEGLDERAGLVCGTSEEVDNAKKALLG